MFAIIKNTLQVLPSSIVLNGVTYTDLCTQSDSALNNLGIYKLPDPPAYDGENFKLSVNLETKQWEVVPLTTEEQSQNLRENYIREFKKLEGKYKSYLTLLESKKEDVFIKWQIEDYITNLVDYMSQVYNQEIPLNDIIEYPECKLYSNSNTL